MGGAWWKRWCRFITALLDAALSISNNLHSFLTLSACVCPSFSQSFHYSSPSFSPSFPSSTLSFFRTLPFKPQSSFLLPQLLRHFWRANSLSLNRASPMLDTKIIIFSTIAGKVNVTFLFVEIVLKIVFSLYRYLCPWNSASYILYRLITSKVKWLNVCLLI